MGVGLFPGRLLRRQLHPASREARHFKQFCKLVKVSQSAYLQLSYCLPHVNSSLNADGGSSTLPQLAYILQSAASPEKRRRGSTGLRKFAKGQAASRARCWSWRPATAGLHAVLTMPAILLSTFTVQGFFTGSRHSSLPKLIALSKSLTCNQHSSADTDALNRILQLVADQTFGVYPTHAVFPALNGYQFVHKF